MGETAATVVGVIIGFIFGVSGIATLLNVFEAVAKGALSQLSSLGSASTIVILIIALVLILKIRVISGLIVGAIIGAVLNTVLRLNGIDLVKVIMHAIHIQG